MPAAPPSKLSKKLIELQIPTTQMIVITESNICELVGFPTLLVAIKIKAVNRPAMVCATKRGSGGRFFISSQSPIKPRTNAGARTDVASQKVLLVKLETSDVEYATTMIPIIMATPPRYGTGCLWDLCAEFGLSTTSVARAILRIKGVSKPTNK